MFFTEHNDFLLFPLNPCKTLFYKLADQIIQHYHFIKSFHSLITYQELQVLLILCILLANA